MRTWLESIENGLTIAFTYGLLFIIPAIILNVVITHKKLNLKQVAFNAMFFIYMSCVLSLVFLPLPLPGTVLNGYKIQLIPFYAVYDTAKDFKLVSLAQIVFNIIMTMPFGAYFAYCKKMSVKKIVLLTAAFSIFIEIGQLTGLFFIYDGSYRTCDIDDLMLNTLGGYIGALAGLLLAKRKPAPVTGFHFQHEKIAA